MANTLTLTITTLLLFAGICTGAPAEEHESFEYFRLYKVELKDAQQLKQFQQLKLPVNVLTDIGPNGGSLNIVVAPKDRTAVEQSLQGLGARFELIIENLREALEQRVQALPGKTTPTAPAMEWTKYHELVDIYDYLDYLTARYPRLVTNYTIGYSYEGRPIKAIKISCKRGNKAIFIDSNIHALEWISSATSTCFVNKLLTSKDKEVKRLLCAYDWIVVPMVNPDGFAYSRVKGQQLWRKNRKPTGFKNESGICYGTDMNRNFDDGHFKEIGYNIDVPCDHWYGGCSVNSEQEIIALQNFYSSFPQDYICMYLTFHNFGNWILLPWGYTNKEFPSNYDDMMEVSQGFVESAKVKYGTQFLAGASGLLNYPVSGSAKDWAYNKKGVCFSATIELRPKSDSVYQFFLPAAQITEVCEEVTDGMVGMMKKAEEIKLCTKCRT